MSHRLKRILPYALIVLFFIVIAYAFVPQVLGGKIVNQSDISGYVGMSHEMNEWNKAHPDDPAYWTDAMFGGMPTTTISAPRQGDWTQAIYDGLLTGKRPATYLFIALLGGFLLLLSLGVDTLLAAGGAVAVAFCSYNFQIIQVGHNTKMQAIAFLPWALAAFIFTYRSAFKEGKGWKAWLPKTVLGAVLFAFAVSFQVKANHQQITYYLALMLIIYALVLLVRLIADKARRGLLGRFFAASALLLVIGVAGIATNANKLIPVYKYTAQSMRGGSELASASNSASGGLTLDYATAWSYGWEELPNLMIPNFNGGSSSGAVNPKHSETAQLFKDAGYSNYKDIVKALPLYWGPQPFTAGPMYMGAITVFLFILGLFLCKPKDKWWIVICTVLAILLALGSHLMGFTKFFYDHMPFYNKFRTVSMALIVLQVTLPALAFLALDRILKGEISAEEFKKKIRIPGAIVAGLCALLYIFPSIAGPFTGSVDAGQQDILVDALQADRRYLLRADALRSFLLILAATALILWGYSVPKDAKKSFDQKTAAGRDAAFARRRTALLLVCALVLVDLFAAGKRYLSADDFVTPRSFNSQFAKTTVDDLILEDEDISYRVLDLTVDPFNSSRRSYWHKNIGGYSPAKLQRYQELISKYLIPEVQSIYDAANGAATITELEAALPELPVMSALNLRYIVLGDENMPAFNKNAYGNAWFVDGAVPASSPDEALELVGSTDLRSAAVLEPADAAALVGTTLAAAAPGDTIAMTSYAPNELHFHYSSAGERLAVFSEVYYPEGWHASLEDTGVEVPVLRADWILRAAVLPAGEHDLVMRFDPPSITRSVAVSRASSIGIIVLLLLAAAGAVLIPGSKKEE
jgi:hypothetical protein